MSAAIFLCFQDKDLCWYCGEWIHVDVRGGLEGPHGNRYCSMDCIDALIEADEQAKQPSRVTGCRHCGYDDFQHALECPTWSVQS